MSEYRMRSNWGTFLRFELVVEDSNIQIFQPPTIDDINDDTSDLPKHT